MKTLIVYYSMGGNTEYAAKEIADRLGADLLRIEPVKAYPDKGFKKFFWGGKASVMAEQPALQPLPRAARRVTAPSRSRLQEPMNSGSRPWCRKIS